MYIGGRATYADDHMKQFFDKHGKLDEEAVAAMTANATAITPEANQVQTGAKVTL